MKSLILILSLFLVAPAFATDGAPPAKAVASAAKAAPAKAPTAPVVAPKPETKAEEPKTAPTTPTAPAPAEKAPGATVVWWEVIVKHAIELGFLLLTLMAAALVRVLGKKYGFAAETDKINDVLKRATGYGEQKSIKAAKLEEGKVTSGAEKMELAVQFAQRIAKDYKIKDKGSDWWEEQLESWLGVNGNGA